MIVNINNVYPGHSFDFKIEAALQVSQNVIGNFPKNEIVFVGYSHKHNKLCAKGVIIEGDFVLFYPIYYETDSLYKKIIAAKVGKNFKIAADISNGVWKSVEFIKIDSTDILNKIKSHNKFKEIMKLPNGSFLNR